MVKNDLYEILITSPPDRELLVAEIWYNREFLIEISQENDAPIVQFYPYSSHIYWKLRYVDVLNYLIEAKNALFEYAENPILDIPTPPLDKFRITVTSLPDSEHLVAEIIYEGVQWAEISQEEKEMRIQFYPHPKKDFWEFPYYEAIAILEKAKSKLLGR